MTKQLNIQVEDLHHEWIRRRAFLERLSMAEVVRNIIDKAITDEGGRSLKDYGGYTIIHTFTQDTLKLKPGMDIKETARRYSQIAGEEFCREFGGANIFVAFGTKMNVEGVGPLAADGTPPDTINDHDTAEAMQRVANRINEWQVMHAPDSVYVHNDLHDVILVNNVNRTEILVDAAVFADFVGSPGDWDNWSSLDSTWSSDGDDVLAVAASRGEVVASYRGGHLVVEDEEIWTELRRSYLPLTAEDAKAAFKSTGHDGVYTLTINGVEFALSWGSLDPSDDHWEISWTKDGITECARLLGSYEEPDWGSVADVINCMMADRR